MSGFRFLGLLSTLFLAFQSHAEYRVFRLKITKTPSSISSSTDSNPNPSPEQKPAPTEESRTVESTLDPVQYPGYYALQADEKVQMTTTWRCFGRTSEFKAFCPNPKEQNLTLQKPSDSPGTAP